VRVENQSEHASRERRRIVFDAAADRYEATRSGYPEALVSRLVETSGLSVGSRVLEIGCGTGQLTRQLVGLGAVMTALDPGPSMIATAKRHSDLSGVKFVVTTFEDYRAGDDRFQLIASATAFHWVDPTIGWAKCAELLRPGGWLALLSTGEEYNDPVRSELRDLYVRNTVGPATWADPPSEEEQARMDGSDDICERWSGKPSASPGLFGSALAWRESSRRRVSSEFVVDLELTRATTLSYEPSKREAFVRDLRAILSAFPSVELTQVSRLVMAPVSGRRARYRLSTRPKSMD
jgi:ubiquinone/menaquinone biosynthesis C-methylase UbiE